MIRSFLYIPVTEQRFLDKLDRVTADAIILDLEDSIPAERKQAAREALSAACARVRECGQDLYVRVNNTPELLDGDLQAAFAQPIDGLIIPKVNAPAQLDHVEHVYQQHPATNSSKFPAFVPLVEDPLGLIHAHAIASHPRVTGISLGAEDFATALGARPTPEVVRMPKLMLHYAAKAAGKLSYGLIRSVADYRDQEALKASVQEAAEFGFDGASCIHPSVVEFLNQGFSVSPEALGRAQRMIDAAEQASAKGIGAFTFEGQFVDTPVVQRAQALVARHLAQRRK